MRRHYIELERLRLWSMLKSMGSRVVRKTFLKNMSDSFDKWRNVVATRRQRAVLERVQARAMKKLLNAGMWKAFKHWKDLVEEAREER